MIDLLGTAPQKIMWVPGMTLYLKGLLAGLLAMFIVVVVSPFIMLPLGYFLLRGRIGEAEGIGWDPIDWLRSSPTPWIVLLLAFVCGFYWEFRHPSK